MVEVLTSQYPLPRRLLHLIACLMAGAVLAQAFGSIAIYLLIGDPQAAGMMANLLMQHLSYYLLACAFVILSVSNVLIRRGVSQLRIVRLPSLILILSVAVASFLIIPRMDYLRETALLDGMPVMLSPFASYFSILHGITLALMCAQIFLSSLIAWRLSECKLS